MVTHAYSLRTWEAETGGFQVQDQPEVHSEILSIKNLKGWGVVSVVEHLLTCARL